MTIKTYKLGVVGLGEGRSIMSAALNSSRWELHRVCDLNLELCKAREAEFNYSRWTTNYEELLTDPEIDTIAIYTPDQLHFKHVKMALEAGKHVICTKPLLVSLEGAKDLIEISEKTGKHVFVGQSTRFFESMIHQRQDYENGRFGEMQTVEAHYITDARWFLERPWSKDKGFSWMYNFLIHPVDLVRWYMPDITEVMGFGRCSKNSRDFGIEAWDSMRFLVRDAEGRIGTISGSYTLPTLGSEIETSIGCTIRGTAGTSSSDFNLQYHTHFSGEGEQTHDYSDKYEYYYRFEERSHHAGEYQNYIEYFAECLDAGKTPYPDVKEGVHTIAIMEALKRSAHEDGRLVTIKEITDQYGI